MDKEHVRGVAIKLLARARKLRGTSRATRTLKNEGKRTKGTPGKEAVDAVKERPQ